MTLEVTSLFVTAGFGHADPDALERQLRLDPGGELVVAAQQIGDDIAGIPEADLEVQMTLAKLRSFRDSQKLCEVPD